MVPIVKKFAEEQGLEYKADGLVKMYEMHLNSLQRTASSAARDEAAHVDALWGGVF